jgi:xylulokinase
MPAGERTVLAIDLGTSGPKVALATVRGRLLGCVSQPTPLHVLPGGGAEQDPADWWAAIVRATQELWATGVGEPRDVVAVCATAQWAGTVPVDRDNTPLCRAIIWMDTRGAKYMRELVGGLVPVQGYGARRLATWVHRTGGVPSLAGKEPVAHIQFLRHERPEIHRAAHKFLEPKDWLVARLCGRFVATWDSIALHWVTDNRAIDRIDYDARLLDLARLERARLPELARATDVVGTLTASAAAELGLRTDVKVLGGTPDVQSAAVGSGAVGDCEPHVYIGTSSWLSCHLRFKKTDLFRNIASLPSALPGRYFLGCAQETAGACLTWLRDRVVWPRDAVSSEPAPTDALARLDAAAAAVAPGADGVLFSPWLFGERCPVADPTIRASFTNVSLATTRGHLVRAVLEGVAFNTRWLLGAAEKFTSRRLDGIRLIGGGARSELWCQILADVLDREIRQVEDPVGANARGAALVAAVGLGELRVEDIAATVPVARTYRPRSELRARYDELFAGYLELYRATKGLHARLHKAVGRDENGGTR